MLRFPDGLIHAAGRAAGKWSIAALLAGTAVVVAILTLYLGAALLLGLIAVSGEDPPGADGIDIYVKTNGVHADIILPLQAFDVDWVARLPLDHLQPGSGPLDHVSFGWGDRGFYLATPTWADLRLSTSVVALLGLDPSVMHVGLVPSPQPGTRIRRLLISAVQYRRLAAFIEAGFRRGRDGAAIEIPGYSYGPQDAFFEAKGRYSPVVTCNEWARRALLAAGVRVPLWSPFDKALLFQLAIAEPQAR